MSDSRLELARRGYADVEIALLWSKETDIFTVSLADPESGTFELVLASNERPLDVFMHPHAYAALRGLTLTAPRAAASPVAGSAIRAEAARGVDELVAYLAGSTDPAPAYARRRSRESRPPADDAAARLTQHVLPVIDERKAQQ
jgi:hypothetical protein